MTATTIESLSVGDTAPAPRHMYHATPEHEAWSDHPEWYAVSSYVSIGDGGGVAEQRLRGVTEAVKGRTEGTGWDLDPTIRAAAQRAGRGLHKSFHEDTTLEQDDWTHEALIFAQTHPEQVQRELDYASAWAKRKGGKDLTLYILAKQLRKRLGQRYREQKRQVSDALTVIRKREAAYEKMVDGRFRLDFDRHGGYVLTEQDLQARAQDETEAQMLWPNVAHRRVGGRSVPTPGDYTVAQVESLLAFVFHDILPTTEEGMALYADIRHAWSKAGLTTAQRDALAGYYGNGRDMSELSDMLGCPRSTIMRRLDSGLALLLTFLNGRNVTL